MYTPPITQLEAILFELYSSKADALALGDVMMEDMTIVGKIKF